MTKLIISDFDRTLFNVNDFFIDFCELILHDEGIKNAELRAVIEEHIRSGDHSAWNSFMTRYHVDLSSVISTISHTLREKSYLYSDVNDFLLRFKDEKVMIMTTGQQEFQEVKLQLVGEFAKLQKHVIPGNKSEYIAANMHINNGLITLPEITGALKFSELYLIDDKYQMLESLVGMKQTKLFHIVRPDAKFPERTNVAAIKSITSLDEVS